MVLAAWLGQQISPLVPVVLLCAGMILAAVIDGIAFKVPNWLTLSMILAGWGIGLLNSFGVTVGPGPIEAGFRGQFSGQRRHRRQLLGTLVAFGLLFPVFLIGGMGQGDVKMQTGFGAWVAALYGSHEGLWTIVYAVCAGYIIGGILALGMIMLRGQAPQSQQCPRDLSAICRVLVTMGPGAAHQRAHQRRTTWHRLPYGIPLCIGFVGTLIYLHWVQRLNRA